MALNIRNPEVEKLATDLAALTGESKTMAVRKALQDRLEIEQRKNQRRRLSERLNEIARHCAALPVLDARSPDEMLYDEHGMPK